MTTLSIQWSLTRNASREGKRPAFSLRWNGSLTTRNGRKEVSSLFEPNQRVNVILSLEQESCFLLVKEWLSKVSDADRHTTYMACVIGRTPAEQVCSTPLIEFRHNEGGQKCSFLIQQEVRSDRKPLRKNRYFRPFDNSFWILLDTKASSVLCSPFWSGYFASSTLWFQVGSYLALVGSRKQKG